jgi:hypothetical protein
LPAVRCITDERQLVGPMFCFPSDHDVECLPKRNAIRKGGAAAHFRLHYAPPVATCVSRHVTSGERAYYRRPLEDFVPAGQPGQPRGDKRHNILFRLAYQPGYIVRHVAAMQGFGLEDLLSRLVSTIETKDFIFIFFIYLFSFSLFIFHFSFLFDSLLSQLDHC